MSSCAVEEDDDREGSGVCVLWVLVRRDGSASGGDGGGFFSFFLFFLLWLVVVSGYGGCGWMWRCLSTVNFFSLFFVSGGCGMGGGFLVGGWCRWCREKERETEEREIGEIGKIKNY